MNRLYVYVIPGKHVLVGNAEGWWVLADDDYRAWHTWTDKAPPTDPAKLVAWCICHLGGEFAWDTLAEVNTPVIINGEWQSDWDWKAVEKAIEKGLESMPWLDKLLRRLERETTK